MQLQIVQLGRACELLRILNSLSTVAGLSKSFCAYAHVNEINVAFSPLISEACLSFHYFGIRAE